jgi:hypothetical protein
MKDMYSPTYHSRVVLQHPPVIERINDDSVLLGVPSLPDFHDARALDDISHEVEKRDLDWWRGSSATRYRGVSEQNKKKYP